MSSLLPGGSRDCFEMAMMIISRKLPHVPLLNFCLTPRKLGTASKSCASSATQTWPESRTPTHADIHSYRWKWSCRPHGYLPLSLIPPCNLSSAGISSRPASPAFQVIQIQKRSQYIRGSFSHRYSWGLVGRWYLSLASGAHGNTEPSLRPFISKETQATCYLILEPVPVRAGRPITKLKINTHTHTPRYPRIKNHVKMAIMWKRYSEDLNSYFLLPFHCLPKVIFYEMWNKIFIVVV